MSARSGAKLSNRQLRTRKDLLLAAARLLRSLGRKPGMEEVAREALVSRATAYRYFPTLESLLVEAPIDDVVPTPEQVFNGDASTDPEERIDRAEAALHDMAYDNELQLRLMLAASLVRQGGDGGTEKVPVRQNRRRALIEAALAPARHRFSDAAYLRLCRSLALILGTESMVVFRDVLPLGRRQARTVKSWAAKALVRAAMQESGT